MTKIDFGGRFLGREAKWWQTLTIYVSVAFMYPLLFLQEAGLIAGLFIQWRDGSFGFVTAAVYLAAVFGGWRIAIRLPAETAVAVLEGKVDRMALASALPLVALILGASVVYGWLFLKSVIGGASSWGWGWFFMAVIMNASAFVFTKVATAERPGE